MQKINSYNNCCAVNFPSILIHTYIRVKSSVAHCSKNPQRGLRRVGEKTYGTSMTMSVCIQSMSSVRQHRVRLLSRPQHSGVNFVQKQWQYTTYLLISIINIVSHLRSFLCRICFEIIDGACNLNYRLFGTDTVKE